MHLTSGHLHLKMLLAATIILLVSGGYISGECPPGWWPGQEGEYCYHVSEHKLTWGESQEVCT